MIPIEGLAACEESGDLVEDGDVVLAALGGSKRLVGTTERCGAWRGDDALDLRKQHYVWSQRDGMAQ